jgi:hypothetical protein
MDSHTVGGTLSMLVKVAHRPRLLLLLLSGLVLPPAQAMAADIPFRVTTPIDVCLLCKGPWHRSSSFCGQNIAGGTERFNFYSAEVNVFSPFGSWECEADRGTCDSGLFGGCIGSPPESERFFCVNDTPNRQVNLIIERDLEIRQDFPITPCTYVAAVAFLGDASSAGRRDRDSFRFEGEAGETITVRLDRDRASGSTGEIAELTVREDRGSTLDERSGALPLELTITLPEAGTYEVEALEVERSAGEPFQGHFFLSVESDAGENRGESLLLEPTGHTEP